MSRRLTQAERDWNLRAGLWVSLVVLGHALLYAYLMLSTLQ